MTSWRESWHYDSVGYSPTVLNTRFRRSNHYYYGLYERYSDIRHYQYLRRLAENGSLAEDLFQQVWLTVYRKISKLKEPAAFRSWLYRIAHNAALMRLRRVRPDQVSVDDEELFGEGLMVPTQLHDWCCLPEHDFESSETRVELERAIKDLPEKKRQDYIWDKIIFSNTIKDPETLRKIRRYKPLVTFDNEDELRKIKEHCDTAGLVLRLKAPDIGSQVEMSSKFGAEPGDARDLITKAFDLGLVVEGLSFHVGSQCTNFDNYTAALDIASRAPLPNAADYEQVIFTGCGSTYYLSLAAAALYQELTGRPARGVPGSELWLNPKSCLGAGKTLLIAVSRSGRSGWPRPVWWRR